MKNDLETTGRYRALLENTRDLIAEVDRDLRIRYVSPNCDSILGYRADELLGRGASELVHPDDRELLSERFARYFAEGVGETVTVRIAHRDGSWRWVESVGTSYVDEGGELRFVAISRDVTEERVAHELLRTSEERYRTVAEVAGELICEMKTDEQLTYVFANRSYRTVLGFEPEELVGTSAWEMIHPDDRTALVPHIEAGGGRGVLFRIRHKTEGWRWVESVAQGFETATGATHLIAVARDVTDRLQAEEERRLRAEELERQVAVRTSELETAYRDLRGLQTRLVQSERLRTTEELAASVAHAINNPLAALLGTVDLAIESASEPDATLNRIARLARRIRDVVEGTLQLFREGDLSLTAERPADILECVHEELRARAASKQIGLTVKSAADLPPVLVDRELIASALAAIADNAIAAMSRGGQLWLELECQPDARVVGFRIADTGPGIPVELREKVFEPFFTTRGKGTGLGLSIARGVVRGHRGRIHIGERPGGGAVVTVELPASG